MQTFLPYADFGASSIALDDRRLGKQRVETFQILRALTWPDYAWKNHPAVRMWRGFVPALVAYGLANCAEWTRRGNADTVEESLLAFTDGRRPDVRALARSGQLPPWLGLPPLHLSHQSALVRKDPAYYRPLFGDVPDDLPYLWPPDAFPRWPVRRETGTVPGLAAALAALGYAEPRPGQAEAVQAIDDGRDVLGCFAVGAGSTSTGLLAGLARPGEALWITTHTGGGGGLPPEGLVPPEPVVRDAPRAAGGAAAAARPPSAVERLAMATESASAPDFRFHRPDDLLRPEVRAELEAHPPTTIVVDRGATGDSVPEAVGEVLAEVRAAHPSAPLLLVGPAADSEMRALLVERYGLRDPVRVGAGFDPSRVLLGVSCAADEPRRRRTLARLVLDAPGPGVVVAADREGARRLSAALDRQGARAAAAVPTTRRSGLEQVIAGWRRGSIRALVLAADSLLPREQLGRRPLRYLHFVGGPESSVGWLDLLDRYGIGTTLPGLSVLTAAGLDTPVGSDLARVLAGDACRRAALLDAVGEPVRVPCGRCDVCLDRPAVELPGELDRLSEQTDASADAVSVAG